MLDWNGSLSILGLTMGVALSLRLLVQRTPEHSEPPLPPGPRAYPLIEHLLSIPQSNAHLGFIELGK